MASGRVVYSGDPGQRLTNFLSAQGYPVPDHCNVADFVLTLINKDFASAGLITADIDALAVAYSNMDDSVAPPSKTKSLEVTGPIGKFEGNGAPWFTRFWVLCGRDMKEVMRDPGILGVRLAMCKSTFALRL